MGNSKRIAYLYYSHWGELTRFLSRRVASNELAADLGQEMFLRMIERDIPVEDIRHPRGYLFRIAHNIAAEAWRSPRWGSDADAVDDLSLGEDASPEALLEQRETIAILLEAIENLPPRCREVFLLHKYEGLSYGEIAEKLGIGRSAVEKSMMRALAACRQALE